MAAMCKQFGQVICSLAIVVIALTCMADGAEVDSTDTDITPVGIRLDGFTHQTCSADEDVDYLIQIQHFNVDIQESEELPSVYEIVVDFAGEVKENITAPLHLGLRFLVRLAGFWIPIPCSVDSVSCEYDDICPSEEDAECPAIFQLAGLPCSCPIEKGQYSTNNVTIQLPPTAGASEVLIVANFTHGAQNVLCQEIYMKTVKVSLDDDEE